MAPDAIGGVPVDSSDRLPRHVRVRAGFAEMFGRSADATIAAMDRAGDDIPNQPPAVPLALQRIGVARTSVPVSIADPFDPGGQTRIACSVETYASLSSDRRGIHISRMGDLVARLAQETFESLQDYAVELCRQTVDLQECDAAEVNVAGVFSYLESLSGGRSKTSLEHLELAAGASVHSGVLTGTSSVGFNIITACPCVQQTLKHALDNRDRGVLGEMLERGLPFLTHSQRCQTQVTIGGEGAPAPIPLVELLNAIDQVVVRSQNTLPRDLELLAVHRAHAAPQFVEDVLRDLLQVVHACVKTSHPASTISIRSKSMESIHDFDISGEISYSVADLNRMRVPAR